MIQSREVSPIEVAEACLARIEAVNPKLNAFVTLTADQAMESAKAAEHSLSAGRCHGPLHGVPIGHKDLFCTQGVRTTGGSRVLRDFIPENDATVVSRLEAAGMVLLGKTNTHEFAYGPTSEISTFGPVRNPWDVDKISGGSSGGSGAAVAAGLVPIASGSDTGGSIRIPASLCGLTGLKPTYGRVSRAGILPLCWSMDHAGPLARSAADAALFLQAVAGKDPADDATAAVPVPDYTAALTGDVRGLRIGVPRRGFFQPAQRSVVDDVDAALKVFEALGARIVEIDIADIEHAAAAALAIFLAEATAYHE
ncbi:MAG: amidase, partial [Planctomycetota bacterium]